MGNGWTNNQVDIQASGGEIEEPWTRRRLPLNSQERNIISHRNSRGSRTLVSHSSQGSKKMVFPSHDLPFERL